MGWGGGRDVQEILPLSIVLNRHCFVWMPLGGVRNSFGKQYGNLSILEQNSDTLSSHTSVYLITTYMLMVSKPICIALSSLLIAQYMFSTTCQASPTFYYTELTSNSAGPKVSWSCSLMILFLQLYFPSWSMAPKFILSSKPKTPGDLVDHLPCLPPVINHKSCQCCQ